MKILFFTPYPFEDASSRLRVYQFQNEFTQNKISFEIYPYTDSKTYNAIYKKKESEY